MTKGKKRKRAPWAGMRRAKEGPAVMKDQAAAPQVPVVQFHPDFNRAGVPANAVQVWRTTGGFIVDSIQVVPQGSNDPVLYMVSRVMLPTQAFADLLQQAEQLLAEERARIEAQEEEAELAEIRELDAEAEADDPLPPDVEPWTCNCNYANASATTVCTHCGKNRPDIQPLPQVMSRVVPIATEERSSLLSKRDPGDEQDEDRVEAAEKEVAIAGMRKAYEDPDATPSPDDAELVCTCAHPGVLVEPDCPQHDHGDNTLPRVSAADLAAVGDRLVLVLPGDADSPGVRQCSCGVLLAVNCTTCPGCGKEWGA